MSKKDKVDTIKRETSKQKFLDALAIDSVAGNVLVACKIAGVTRSLMYRYRNEDLDFAVKWNQCVKDGRKILLDMAYNVLYQSLANQNLTASIFVLKTLNPKIWNDRIIKLNIEDKPQETYHEVSPEYAKMLNEKFPDLVKQMKKRREQEVLHEIENG